MQRSSSTFHNLHRSDLIIRRLQVRLLQLVLGVIFSATGLFVISFITSGQSLFAGINIVATIGAASSLILLFLVGRQYLLGGIASFAITYMMIIGYVLFIENGDSSMLLLILTLITVTSALVAPRLVFRALMLGILAMIIWVAIQVEIDAEGVIATDNILSILLIIASGAIPLSLGLFSRYFVSQIVNNAIEAQRSVNLLSASADIGNDVSQMLELNVLLDRAVEIIRDRFAFYHVSVFLLGEQQKYANLISSTGDVGERMLARGHRLSVDSNSVVGRAAQSQEVIITRDTDDEKGHAFNELLPFTRSELALPITDHDGIVGVLDIQSRRPDAFTGMEIDALRVITNQLTTAIRNARLFEDKELSIRENKRLFIEAETNLREIQRLNRQLTRQAWVDYLRTDRRIDGVTLGDSTFQNTAEWTDAMIDASRRRRPITEESGDVRKIAVPIELRGEVVGAIELETSPTNKKDDLVDMVRTVSSRLAVSLDNARLFEESNEATAQEQRVSEIVSQYQSAESVDELLRVTIQGLAETLGAEQASIRLGAVPDITELESDPEMPTSDTNGGNSA